MTAPGVPPAGATAPDPAMPGAVSLRAAIAEGRLRLDGLVTVERQGHFAYYSMHDPLVREIVGALYKRFCPAPPGAAS